MSRFSIQHYYGAAQPLITLGQQIEKAGRLEPALVQLVLMRVSQISGCAFCLDMHSKDARAACETEQGLYLLPAWRETKLYSERERVGESSMPPSPGRCGKHGQVHLAHFFRARQFRTKRLQTATRFPPAPGAPR